MLRHHHELLEMKKGSISMLKLRLWTDTDFHLAPKHLIMSRYNSQPLDAPRFLLLSSVS